MVALVAALGIAVLVTACGSGDEPGAGSTRSATGAVEAAGYPVEDLDLVLVTIDTLRADTLGFAGDERVETPVLDRLAAAGRVFDRAYAHNVVTLPSHANLLTGLYPYQHGVRDNSGFQLGEDVPTLATELSAAGWATGAFVAAVPLDSRYGLDRGFDVYSDDYPEGSRPTQFRLAERRGDEVIAEAVDWWRENAGQKRFLWVHLYDPHAPYQAPEPWGSRHAAEPYLGEVEATDAFLEPLLAPFLDGSEERPTLVAVTSDHGESLGEHGELTHGLFAYEPTLKVPLVLWGAGVEPGWDDRVVGHVDLAPTLLQAAGVGIPEGVSGISLLAWGEPLPERRLYFEALSTWLNRGWAPLHGLLEGEHKYIRLPEPELYDVIDDPGETDNRIAAERRLYHALRDALPEDALRPPERGAVSAAEAAELRSLGYLVGGGGLATEHGPEDDPKNLVDLDTDIHRVVALYSEGRLDEAERLARQVVEERPTMALGYQHLATVLKERDRVAEAAEALEQALNRGIDHPTVVRDLGLTLAELGRAEEAIRLLEPMVGVGQEGGGAPSGDASSLDRVPPDASPVDLEMLAALGIAYYTAGRLDEAEAVFERVLEEDPDNVQATENMASVALGRRDAEAARRWAERALELNDELPISWNNLGVARRLTGDTEGAMAAWQRAWELDPSRHDALYNAGMVALASERWSLARNLLGRYLEAVPASGRGEDLERVREIVRRLDAELGPRPEGS